MADEEILYAIPKVNPTTINNYIHNYLESVDFIDGCFTYEIDDVAVGLIGFIHVPFDCVITGWSLLANISGSIVVNIWKNIFANFPPTVADKITASAPPTINAAQAAQSAVLTDWTVALNAGDVIAINIDSFATIAKVTLTIFYARVL